jgi:uncharacterized protein YkwD
MIKIKFLLLALVFSHGIASHAADADCQGMDAEACATFSLTNAERLKAGLPAFKHAADCAAMAQDQSDDMSHYGYFEHSRPAVGNRPAETFLDRARRFGMLRGVGENIAHTRSAARAMEMWMESSGHRKNILNPRLSTLGVGHRSVFYTQVFGR